jgi:NAD(P)-dependent dehydrogenase (short-subunit alcohol dehydrogenase family)
LDDDAFLSTLQPKLLGQVELTRAALQHLSGGGSITLTSGVIPTGLPGSAGGALVNAGLNAFVRTAADEMPRAIRLNAVSPGWISESLQAAGMDPRSRTPAPKVANAYAALVDGRQRGQIVTP